MQSTMLPKRVCLDIEQLIRKFIWGSTSSPKVSLVNWEALCQPLTHRGLGFRRVHEFNIDFILKIGFSLITATNSLWIRFLREKYKLAELLPLSIQRTSCTPLWRALSKHWDTLRLGVAWSLGSGSSIHPLTDVWIPSIGPLHSHLQPEALLSPIDSFFELLDSSGNWDRDKLCAIFHPDVIPHILGVKCPEPTDIPDQITWRWTPKGNFEVRSAYSNLASDSWDPNHALWKHIWQMTVPQRLRVFLWVVSRRKLMTNLEHCNRHISSSSLCPLCSGADESILHVLRDCRASSEVWEMLLPSSLSLRFVRQDLLDWIEDNLRSGLLHTEWDIPWSVIFVSTIWQLWKNRNDFVFNAVLHSKEAVAHRAITWARYYSGCFPPCSGVATLLCEPPTWRRPDPGWTCLNVDGAVSMGSNAGAVGGLYRDHSGAWIVQTDCKEVVNMLHALDADRSTFSLVRAIAKLRQKCWMTDIIWVSRDGNRAADMLEKLMDASALDMLRLLTPPRCLIPLLQHDAPDASFA
ncbi:hypothetical protein V6N11_022925 [Hibiscus sabdariffa]|uniref:Reverse transcriptase zinc-binding domain-containing protein n=1 Tax=Hibiscus sabdariffa TaxID=183260 RepID=A0ABR2TLE6_9ROSI